MLCDCNVVNSEGIMLCRPTELTITSELCDCRYDNHRNEFTHWKKYETRQTDTYKHI